MSNSFANLKAELLARMVRGEITMPEYVEFLAEIERQAAESSADQQPASPRKAPPRKRGRKQLELLPDMSVEKFKLVEYLGEGGMGQVWKAWDPSEQNFVVLKFLPPELRRSETDIAQFRETYRRVRRLHHMHICPLYDLGEDPHAGTFQVMLFLDGISLNQWWPQHADSQGRLPLSQVEQVLRPVALALDYAHKEGVIHRDVKPGNIMVTESPWDIHVIDFGLAAELQKSVTRTSRVQMDASGTQAYMAPEQWLGKFQDHQTDQYALAVVAYEMLAGRLPFDATNAMALAFAVTNSDPDAISGLPQAVNAALLKALSRQRKDRFEKCIDFVEALKSDRVAHIETRGIAAVDSRRAPDRLAKQQLGLQPSHGDQRPLPREFTNSIGMRFVLIEPGEFMMGSNEDEDEDEDEGEDHKPRHLVRISRPFYLGVFPVTQAEYQAVMGQNPSQFAGNPRHPVERVSWDDAVAYEQKLSQLSAELSRGRTYRLPTEAEWEYACRAGSTGKWCFGDQESQLGDYAWFDGDSEDDRTHRVGKKKPNAWGLHDMHGNVFEWCLDWYDGGYYEVSPTDDPTGPFSGSRRVQRGGSWFFTADLVSSASRLGIRPDRPIVGSGVRLAQVPEGS